MFKETHPIMGTRDMRRAIAFYTQKLGFELAFGAEGGELDAEHPNYLGYRFYRRLTPAERMGESR